MILRRGRRDRCSLAGCAKHEAAAEPARPVVLAQVVAGSGGDTAVFAGEVKPRHESDLGFRIGGKIVARAVDAGAHVKQGPAARAPRPGGRRLAGARRRRQQVAAAQTEYDFAKAEYERYQHLLEQKFVSASRARRRSATR